MTKRITIEPAKGTWAVRAGGAVIGESDRALILREEGYPFVVYFPREHIAMAFLDRSEKTTMCPHKGTATYYSIAATSVAITDAAFSYEDPKEEVAQIAGHLAFQDEDVTVERI